MRLTRKRTNGSQWEKERHARAMAAYDPYALTRLNSHVRCYKSGKATLIVKP